MTSIALVGLPGSGKTTIGKLLARRLGMDFADSDHVIEERLGCPIRAFWEQQGEAAFRDIEQATIEDLARQAVDLGLRHLAITDHHSTAALAPAQHCLEQLAAQGRPGPRLWSGIEISCLLEGCLVHVLGLDFDPQARALEPYRQGQAPVGPELKAKEVVKRLHGAGGLALLAHPGRYRKPFGLLIDAAADLGFDGAEAYYDYAMAERWQPTPLVCEAIANQLQNLGLLRSCGTDTHGLALHGR